MFQTKVVENIKTHFMFNDFFLEVVPFEIMRKNIVKPDRPQMTIWRMHFGKFICQFMCHVIFRVMMMCVPVYCIHHLTLSGVILWILKLTIGKLVLEIQYGCNRLTIALVVMVINIRAAEDISWTVRYPPVCLKHSNPVLKASLLVCF